MTPGSMTPTERREALHASLAHHTLKPLAPDPTLTFVVKLGLHRPTPKRTAP